LKSRHAIIVSSGTLDLKILCFPNFRFR